MVYKLDDVQNDGYRVWCMRFLTVRKVLVIATSEC